MYCTQYTHINPTKLYTEIVYILSLLAYVAKCYLRKVYKKMKTFLYELLSLIVMTISTSCLVCIAMRNHKHEQRYNNSIKSITLSMQICIDPIQFHKHTQIVLNEKENGSC